MAKKPKKPSSETLVKSILEDLQADNDEVSMVGPLSDDESEPPGAGVLGSDGELVPETTRILPEGLDSETAVFGFSKKKKGPPDVTKISRSEESSPFGELAKNIELPPIPDLNAIPEDEPKLPVVAQESKPDFPAPPMNEDATFNISEPSMTRRIQDEPNSITFKSDFTDRTQPMIRHDVTASDASTKISHGLARPLTKSSASMAASATESQMLQAENLKMAQSRIIELEKEVELLRQENELLSSAGEIAKKRVEELFEKTQEIERAKVEALEQAQMEMNIYRENLVDKERQLGRQRQKIDELQSRLAKDLKKIRVRERELENRLELAKMEKTALVRAKDDAILELKHKLEGLESEIETYKNRCLELGQKVDNQHDQLNRTVRALRLALTHLESNDVTGTVTPLKKAE